MNKFTSIFVSRLLVLIFFTGPLLKNNESEEALAKKLLDSQNEDSAYRKELGWS